MRHKRVRPYRDSHCSPYHPYWFIGGTRRQRIKAYRRQAGRYERQGKPRWAEIELERAAEEAKKLNKKDTP